MRRLFRLPIFSREAAAREVDAELAFHLQMRVEELVARGASPEEARAEALRRFGDLARARSELEQRGAARVRRSRVAGWLSDLGQDLLFALRSLSRRRGFAAMAVGTIAVGLGLTTTVLAVVNRLVLHPYPYPDAERLGLVYLASDETAIQISPTLRMLELWRRAPSGLQWIEGYNDEQLLLESRETAELVQTKSVTPGFLPALGARMALGRGIQPADTAASAALVAVLSWSTWQRRYGGASDVLGRTVRINGRVAAIVGVLGRGFDITPLDRAARAELGIPRGRRVARPAIRGEPAGEQSASVLVLRRPGVTPATITRGLQATLTAAGVTSPLLDRFRPRVIDPASRADPDRDRTLWLLTIAVILVLAVACANVAALLLGQSAVRAQEFGVRAALGAGRGRVVRQLLTEAAALAALGGAAGLGIAGAALRVTRWIRPDSLLALDDVALEPRVMLVALAVTLLVALFFGAAPAWAASRDDAAGALVGRIRRSLDTRFGRRLRGALVAGQLAGSLVLLAGAGLCLRSFLAQRNLPLGFEPRGLSWVQIDLSRRDIPAAELRDAIASEAAAAVRALPGIDAVALAANPPTGFGLTEGEILIEGRPLPDPPAKALIPLSPIGPGYFSAMGTRLEAGRAPETTSEIVIDTEAARNLFPAGNPVGSRIRFQREAGYYTIVGTAAVSRGLIGAFPGMPMVFLPMLPGERGGTLLIRGRDAGSLARISAAIRKVDSRIRIRSMSSATAAVDEQLAPRRFTTTVVTGFAALALLLAAVGLYGVIALAVSQRSYEIGVRIALGAAPGAVRGMVLRQGALPIAAGLGLGFLLLALSGRLLRALLADLRVWDPGVWAAAALVLAAAGVLACWTPARRASRIDPLIAIRGD